jgi:hypothetical protein
MYLYSLQIKGDSKKCFKKPAVTQLTKKSQNIFEPEVSVLHSQEFIIGHDSESSS